MEISFGQQMENSNEIVKEKEEKNEKEQQKTEETKES